MRKFWTEENTRGQRTSVQRSWYLGVVYVNQHPVCLDATWKFISAQKRGLSSLYDNGCAWGHEKKCVARVHSTGKRRERTGGKISLEGKTKRTFFDSVWFVVGFFNEKVPQSYFWLLCYCFAFVQLQVHEKTIGNCETVALFNVAGYSVMPLQLWQIPS